MRAIRLLLIPAVVGILTTLLQGWEVGAFAGLLVGIVNVLACCSVARLREGFLEGDDAKPGAVKQ